MALADGLGVSGGVWLALFDEFVELGSIAEARAKGKQYVMSDGDVVEFRFNN